MAEFQTCVTCGKQAPETQTNYTLISSQFGWRLTRYKRKDGGLVLEWRCPSCWEEFKRAKTGATPDKPGSQPPGAASSKPPAVASALSAPEGPRRPGRGHR